MCVRERETGAGGGEDKGRAVFPDVVLCVGSSQLLLQGLLHLHFSLKIAPVIIYLAGARHPALCSQRIVFFLLCLSLYEILALSLSLTFSPVF